MTADSFPRDTTGYGASTRVDALEQHLADPFDDDNPLGFAALLRADERGELCAEGERALDARRLNADFVPTALGGTLSRFDDLVASLRAVYRRDPSLGLGYGMSSFIAAVNVWLAGNERQRRAVADLLLSGGRIAAAYHELAHGNDMAGAECAVRDTGDGLVLRGRKEVVTNIRRAEALVVFARTDERRGSRSHSQVLVERRDLDPSRVHDLPRFTSSGMRGVPLHGLAFDGCPLPPGSILGRTGNGLETALRSFQITRTLLPAVMCGPVETGLRVTLRHLLGRGLYGRAATDLPYLRTALAGAYADLLAVECLSAVTVRAVQVLPAEVSVFASLFKHFGSGLLLDVMHTLSELMGAHFYLRTGPSAIFQKLLRDVRVVGFGHAARGACESNVLPQLPVLARRSWAEPDPRPAPEELFRLDAPLPPLVFDRLRLTASGSDHLGGSLAASVSALSGAAADLGDLFVDEHAALARDCRALPSVELGVGTGPRSSELVTRTGHVLAAAACLGIWRHNQHSGALPGDPVWVQAVLTRLYGRLRGRPAALPDALAQPLFDELTARFAAGRAFDLTARVLPDAATTAASRPPHPTSHHVRPTAHHAAHHESTSQEEN
ncbi:acyl-CoA dehydrogenase [Streptomyces tubbatahanensis]|uniref:Acyl-CoA dehydrogenase n=1 Tax=Streptomyces tubbatahanensis TaxID=2923272 RepID=A0ABY3XKY9_9ACTN|nr:acyl-CoA dehydrogenase [Streptomyces tubbatahanensis]UNS95069.1 acyl-CoA dehydrogenase [Streptomyces tubbatahanensis]